MAYYYVNQHAQANGDHEVHVAGCLFYPADTIYLGDYASCPPAIEQTKFYFYQSNGCYFCCNPCHTT